MGRTFVAAAGFALAGGSAADPGASVHVAPVPDRFGRILLLCVEPLDHTPRGRELAAVAQRTIQDQFSATPGPGEEALAAAFAVANGAILAENRPFAGARGSRRVCVGATAIAIDGRTIAVAQAPPSQAIVVQDGQVYAFPDLASWRGDFVSADPAPEAHPLGFAEDTVPRFFVSAASPGDLIALCSSTVGRVLGRDESAVFNLYGGSLLTSDLEGSVDRLERLIAPLDVRDAFAVVVSLTRLAGRRGARSAFANHTSTPAADHDLAAASSGEPPPGRSAPIDDRPPLFQGVRDWTIDLAETMASHRTRQMPAYDARQRALAAPGALSVQRYRDSSGLPAEWRANLPRGPMLHLPARFLAVTLIVLLAISGTTLAVNRQRERDIRANAALTTVDAALRRALENPGTATSSIADAETAFAAAREAGADAALLASRQQDLISVRDALWGVQRLRDVERVGALPMSAGDGPVGLALSGRTLYLAAGNLYELDADAGLLIALLSRGDQVGDEIAGDLRHASVDSGIVVTSDGKSVYGRDEAGIWQYRPLAVDEVGGLRPGSPLIAWGEAAYGLSWDGDITRFDQTINGPVASLWAEAVNTPDLIGALDIAIDGRIHVLLEDGRTLTFSRGQLIGTQAPFVVPPLAEVAYLAESPFSSAFYLIDRGAHIGENRGRIVRFTAQGDARQFLTPPSTAGDAIADLAATTLANAADVAIDELSGTVFWVSNGEIWRAKLPLV